MTGIFSILYTFLLLWIYVYKVYGESYIILFIYSSGSMDLRLQSLGRVLYFSFHTHFWFYGITSTELMDRRILANYISR